jgi:hypothetical protein
LYRNYRNSLKMIFQSLQLLCERLNGYLRLRFRLTEDIVFLSPVKDTNNAYPNRVSVTVVGMDRDTSAGISFQRKSVSDSVSAQSAPAWQVSLNVLLSVVFQDKQYEESLRLFAALVGFVQKNNLVRSGDDDHTFSLEVVNLTINELSNLWSVCGETYYPSLLCRIRVLTVDSDEITDLSYVISQPEPNTDLK